jgi:protein-L-isoaspartate(D-aspartate) O-methyltransferase
MSGALRGDEGAPYKPREEVTMTADFNRQRETMVDSQVRTQDVTDAALIEAIRATPREDLTPAGKAWLAYADAEVEYAPGRWLLRPRDIAKLLQALKPKAGEKALAVSAPYAAAVLARMGLEVMQIDATGAVSGAWNLVVCEGAVAEAPEAWKAGLAPGGRLGVVERDGPVGRAKLFVRTEQAVGVRVLFDSTPPVLAGFEPRRNFAL